MRYARIERLETGDQGTFGRIVTPGLVLFSGELPWRNNRSNVSCIPPGPGEAPVTYDVVWTYSPRFRRHMYLLLGTDPRAGIREHSANFVGDDTLGYRRQLNGCIAFGEKLGWMEGQKVLLISRPAVTRFENHMRREPFKLEIINGY